MANPTENERRCHLHVHLIIITDGQTKEQR